MGVGGPPKREPVVPTILGLKEGDGHWEGQGWEGPTEKKFAPFYSPTSCGWVFQLLLH